MDEALCPLATPGKERGRSFLSGDRGLLAVLLLVSAAIHGWLICHTVVPARDGVDFMGWAWQLEHCPWREVLANSDRQPGYAVAILAMSIPVRHLLGGMTCDTMVLSAQLVSALAGCLLVIPLFFLGRKLFHAAAGFGAALLFACLPVSARVLSDTLSESLFLLLAATTLWMAVRALDGNSALRFGLTGLFAALAYLVRVEGALLVPAIALILLGKQAVPDWRRPWRKVLASSAALYLAVGAVAGPFVIVSGHFSSNPTGQKVLNLVGVTGEKTSPQSLGNPFFLKPNGQRVPFPHGGASRPLIACPLAVWWLPNQEGSTGGRLAWSFWAVLSEIAKGFQYLAFLAALLGIFLFRGRLRSQPGLCLVLLVCFLQGLAVWRVAYRAGYASERHVLLIVMCGLFWAAAALVEIPRRLLAFPSAGAGTTGGLRAKWGSAVLVGGMLAIGLPKTLQPLHPNELGYRIAGTWLAEHAGLGDIILDPSEWASFYAGRIFQAACPAGSAGSLPAIYVVLDRARNQHDKEIFIAQARYWADRGTVVFAWKPEMPKTMQGEVTVYRVDPPH